MIKVKKHSNEPDDIFEWPIHLSGDIWSSREAANQQDRLLIFHSFGMLTQELCLEIVKIHLPISSLLDGDHSSSGFSP